MIYTVAAIRVAIASFSQMLCPFIAIGQTLETSLEPFEKVELGSHESITTLQ